MFARDLAAGLEFRAPMSFRIGKEACNLLCLCLAQRCNGPCKIRLKNRFLSKNHASRQFRWLSFHRMIFDLHTHYIPYDLHWSIRFQPQRIHMSSRYTISCIDYCRAKYNCGGRSTFERCTEIVQTEKQRNIW
nr:hypothetical protein Iba_chr05cCG5370 [Ipomoea batatas]